MAIVVPVVVVVVVVPTPVVAVVVVVTTPTSPGVVRVPAVVVVVVSPLVVVVVVVEVVVLLAGGLELGVEVGESATDLGHNPPPSRRVSHPAEVGPHGLNEPHGLGVGRHCEGPLNNVVPKGIGHQVLDLLRVADLPHIELLSLVVCLLEALLHDITAELLDGEHGDPPRDALADSVGLLVAANVEDVLNDVVTVSVLHELKGLLDNLGNEVAPGGALGGVKAPLDDATAVAVPCDLPNAGSHGIEDEPGVLVGKTLKDTLDDVVAIGVDAEAGGLRRKGLGDGGGSIGVEGAHLDHLLNAPRPVKVEGTLHELGSNRANDGKALGVRALL
mmetsp:Transcript_10147/g.20776  ORF Transcript_10147/g.20776 Transcript_10147/m.20776 type:complete len:331 (-) Transcript_10147:1356-2348(-)